MRGKGVSRAMYDMLFAKRGGDFVEGTFLKSETMGDNYDSFMEVFNKTGDALKAARNPAQGKALGDKVTLKQHTINEDDNSVHLL